MKKVMFVFSLSVMAELSLVMSVAYGAVMDQAAKDMLTSTTEDENEDAVSRWGDTSQKHQRKASPRISYSLTPIEESSFEGAGPSRAPASVRAPAGAVDGVIVAPKTIARVAVTKKAVQEVSIIANDYGFFPSTIFVTQGVPVRLFVTGASARSQCFILDSFGVLRQIRTNKIEEISFTPDQSGNFAFNCPMNGAKGAMVVKALDVGARVPASEDRASSPLVPQNGSPKKNSLIQDEDFGLE